MGGDTILSFRVSSASAMAWATLRWSSACLSWATVCLWLSSMSSWARLWDSCIDRTGDGLDHVNPVYSLIINYILTCTGSPIFTCTRFINTHQPTSAIFLSHWTPAYVEYHKILPFSLTAVKVQMLEEQRR